MGLLRPYSCTGLNPPISPKGTGLLHQVMPLPTPVRFGCTLQSREEAGGEQQSSRVAWAATSVIGIALSSVISVSVPFFDVIVAAIGALGDLAAAYALPALFVLVRRRRFWRTAQIAQKCALRSRCDLQWLDVTDNAGIQRHQPCANTRLRPCLACRHCSYRCSSIPGNNSDASPIMLLCE